MFTAPTIWHIEGLRPGLAINGYELRNALTFLAPNETPDQLQHKLVISLHDESQEMECPETGLYARHERFPEDIAILLVYHATDVPPPTVGLAPGESDEEHHLRAGNNHLVMTGYQIRDALTFLAPDGIAEQLEQKLVIEFYEQDANHPVAGLYAFHDECPEEGSLLLVDHQDQGSDAGAPVPTRAGLLDQLRTSRSLAGGESVSRQLERLDKQCRNDVARALGLTPSEDRGFAWSYLLTEIKSVVAQARNQPAIQGESD